MARVKDVLVLDGSTVYRVSKSKYVAFLTDRAAGGASPLVSFGAKEVLRVDVVLPLTSEVAVATLSALGGPVSAAAPVAA